MASTVPQTERTDDDLAAVVARRGESAGALHAAQKAFEQLYRRHAPLLLAFVAARVRPADRDDLHQEVWERAWNHLPEQFHGGNVRAWLHQIARNAIIDLGRKARPESLAAPEALLDGRGHSAHERLIEYERSDALRHCLEKLNNTAAALVRARLSGDDYAEICQRLGLAPQKAHKLFHTSKDQLKTCVERALR
jgi:RNA polymerase sigma-70 factor (ECF subfamily)